MAARVGIMADSTELLRIEQLLIPLIWHWLSLLV
ncbi:hypothetical protein MAE30S32_46460 [Microcystis aeruginosa 11-30S32]|uniref:Uncharacterized protein n=1 Tax=Microcystis aeruginosa 11-30S32 TaxID=2358142 RepID=A0A510PR89_MICAE|nr:hypothetical protein MAE30S32_46450 [Microcystis aeruginosa 11-30S32]GCA95994.1 hypothetical protein MAE30S32_46460 [Microcystis aeruginosa 11-30S32]